MSLIIAIVNQKGGTGKTTTAINLGSALAKLGNNVLLVDLDPQGNLSYSLGLNSVKFSMADIFEGKKKINQIIIEKDNLSVAPGSTDLADIDISLVNQENREFFLKNCLSDVKGKYDCIIIDAPPSLSLLTINALAAADEVLIPLQLEVLTLQGLNQILNTISSVRKTVNKSLKINGLVFVMYDKRRKLSQEIFEFISKNIKENIYKTLIRSNVKIAEAPSFGQSVVDYDPSSNGAMDYMKLAKEFISAKNKKQIKNKKQLTY